MAQAARTRVAAALHVEEDARPGAPAGPRSAAITEIDAGRIPILAQLREVWTVRELLYFLVVRDITLRYKQTVLGVAWAVIQPLFLMIVFSIFLGRLAGVPADGLPYPLFVLCGLVPWQLFAHAVNGATVSVVENERLITRVYFPRIVIPVAAVLSGLVDFAIALLLLLVIMAFYGIAPTTATLTLPFFALLALLAAVSLGLWFAAANVQYRDVRYTVPFLLQLGLFATPIAYPASLLSAEWRLLLHVLNPLTGVVGGFRWALLGAPAPDPVALLLSTATIGALGLGGLWFFQRSADSFADII